MGSFYILKDALCCSTFKLKSNGRRLKTVTDFRTTKRRLQKQVLNPQKGVSGTHSFKLMHIYIAPMVNTWRSEVGSVNGLQNSTLGLVFGLQYLTLGREVGLQYSSLGWVVRLQY